MKAKGLSGKDLILSTVIRLQKSKCAFAKWTAACAGEAGIFVTLSEFDCRP